MRARLARPGAGTARACPSSARRSRSAAAREPHTTDREPVPSLARDPDPEVPRARLTCPVRSWILEGLTHPLSCRSVARQHDALRGRFLSQTSRRPTPVGGVIIKGDNAPCLQRGKSLPKPRSRIGTFGTMTTRTVEWLVSTERWKGAWTSSGNFRY